MSILGQVISTIEAYDSAGAEVARQARTDPAVAEALLQRWRSFSGSVSTVTTPTGLQLPRLALPALDEPGAIARFLHQEGLPGEFPFVSGAYPQMYSSGGNGAAPSEEPTRLFAGLGLAEDTNQRFHYLVGHQRSVRLSTAFDGPTLYGIDSDADGASGKVGEGGVAVDTVDDMVRLYDGFDLTEPNLSVSMTVSGPAPALLAMYVAAARRRFGADAAKTLRGTIQADILKEVQAQNEVLYPVDASLRFLADMIAWTSEQMPRWYPISISGYHIAEAGATPVQQAAYTLSNGLAYVEMLKARGLAVDQFGPRLSFFLDCGLDVEYLVLGRVCRKIWAIVMRDVFGAGDRAQRFKLHTQTSGRSLVAREFKNNLTRTAVELMMAYANATNSCHSNAADEAFTTPSEEYARLASHAQSILLEESGLFKHVTNLLGSSPGMLMLQEVVQRAILDEFRRIDEMGGVLAAMEQRYQRSQIQLAAYRYEAQIHAGERPIVGVNRYRMEANGEANVRVVRTPREKQRKQIARLKAFKKKHAKRAPAALDALEQVVRAGGNTFEELLKTVEVCSLGQITRRLQEVVGRFRPMV